MPNLTLADQKFLQAIKEDDLTTVQLMRDKDYIKSVAAEIMSDELFLIPINHNSPKMLHFLLTNASSDLKLSLSLQDLFEHAVRVSSLDIIKLMATELNEHINQTNAMGLAAERGNIEILQFLIDRGVDINLKNRFGETPIEIALDTESVNAVKFLIEHDANLSIRDRDMYSFRERLDYFLKKNKIVIGKDNNYDAQDRITKLETEMASLKAELAELKKQLKTQQPTLVEPNQQRSIFR